MHILITSLITIIISFFSGLLLEGMNSIMDGFGESFHNNFGSSLKIFYDYFGKDLFNDITDFLCGLSVFLIMVLLVIGIFRNITSGLGFAGENPLMMLGRVFGAVIVTFSIQPMFIWIYEEIFGTVFEQIKNLAGNESGGAFSSFAASFEASIFPSLVFLFFTIMIFKSMLELVIEFVERYLMVSMLILLSPLAACAIVLKSTMKTFSTYCKMFFSHLLLLIMTSLTLTMLISCINYVLAEGMETGIGTGLISQFLPLIIIYAFTRIAERIDNYINDVGLRVGVTGGDLFSDMYSAFRLSTAPGHMVADSKIGGNIAKSVANKVTGKSGAEGLTNASATFGQRASSAINKASNGALTGNSKISDMRKDNNGNTWMKAVDANGNEHLVGLSDKPLKDANGNTLTDKDGNPISKAFQGENGQSYYLTDYSAGVLGAKAGGNADEIAAAQEILNPAMRGFGQMEQVANIGSVSESNSASAESELNSGNSLNFESAMNDAQINGVNVKDFSAMADSSVEMTPDNYNSVAALQGISENNGGSFALTGEDGRASAADVSTANLLDKAGLEITSQNMGVAQDLGNILANNGYEPTQDNIASVMLGSSYQFSENESMAVGEAMRMNGLELNKENFDSYVPIARELSVGGYDVTPENINIVKLGSSGDQTSTISPDISLAFADKATSYGLSKEDGVMLAKSISQAGVTPEVNNIDQRTVNYFKNNRDANGFVPRNKMRKFLKKK